MRFWEESVGVVSRKLTRASELVQTSVGGVDVRVVRVRGLTCAERNPIVPFARFKVFRISDTAADQTSEATEQGHATIV